MLIARAICSSCVFTILLFQINDCEEAYNSFMSIPKSTDASTGTIRGFFNAYLLHSHFIDYIVNLNKEALDVSSK